MTIEAILAIEGKTFGNKGSNREFFLDAILSNIGKFDVIMTPEYVFNRNQPYTVTEKEEVSEQIRTATVGDNGLVATTFLWQDDANLYNSCVLFSNGEIIFDYLKETDFCEGDIAKAIGKQYVTGNRQGFAQWNGHKVGVEICRDHGLGRLGRYLRNFSDEDSVDIHLVPAKGVSCHTDNIQSDLFLLNDGGTPHDNKAGSMLLQKKQFIPSVKTKYGSAYIL
jgi:predicted amidohydrolase